MITVVAAPPYASVQDLGRIGLRASGIPPSGVADRATALALNKLLGNAPDAAMLEWAVAGGTLRFDADVTFALGGATVEASISGEVVQPYSPIRARATDELHVERLASGRFLYIAVRGGIDVPVVLGSRSTLMSAGFGGHEGRRVRKGDVLHVGREYRSGSVHPVSDVNAENRAHSPRLHDNREPILIMRGPQAALFDADAWSTFLGTLYIISRASDRTGYRLDGPPLSHVAAAALPSEPTCVGAIQVPNGGAPIVLMQDGPTVGGYPKIAVIRSSALSRFAQKVPGEGVRFLL